MAKRLAGSELDGIQHFGGRCLQLAVDMVEAEDERRTLMQAKSWDAVLTCQDAIDECRCGLLRELEKHRVFAEKRRRSSTSIWRFTSIA